MMRKVTLVTAVRKAGKGNGCRDGGSTVMQGSAGKMAELGNLGLRRRRQWELQGTLGGGKYEVSLWQNPLSGLNKPF